MNNNLIGREFRHFKGNLYWTSSVLLFSSEAKTVYFCDII